MNELIYNEYLERAPDYEIIEGVKKFMSPSPHFKHGSIVGNLIIIFGNYFWKNPVAKFIGDNMDVHLPDGNVFKPDFSVICDKSIIKEDGKIHGVPDLIVEILSHSTIKNDRGIKKDIYERNGVKEYWIIDYWNKNIEVYYLVGGRFYLDCVYHLYNQQELELLTEEEKAEIKTEIKVSLFDDLIVDINKVFMWI